MPGPLTDIANRLTPSTPLELTFGAQPVAVGVKFTTLFGHRAATGGTGIDYHVYQVVNVGDPDAVKSEVDAIAGTGSQLGKMAAAFVKANALALRSNFPAFRIVLIPSATTDFGPTDDALTAVKFLRTDMFVSCYPASDAANRAKLLALVQLLSGVDRDLSGQFGSFMILGDIDVLGTAVTTATGINNLQTLVAYHQDTNTALVNTTGDTQTGPSANLLINLASVAGIYPGAVVTGTGIPAATTVLQVLSPSSVKISANATSANAGEALAFQNVVSQPEEIVAAAHAGAMMSFGQPYIPLQGVTIGGLIQAQKPSDKIVPDPAGASETALRAGLSVLSAQADGTVGFIRTVTTLTTKPDTTPVTAYFDWQDIVTLFDFKESVFLASRNPPFNNNPGGSKLSQQLADKFGDEVIRLAFEFEKATMFQNVKLSAKFFQVAVSKTSRGRLDFKVPVEVLPGAFVFAGNIEAVSDLTTFTL